MKRIVLITALALGLATTLAQDKPPANYTQDFQNAAVDSLPDEFLVLDGAFAVKEEGDNKFLELPGSPLDTFGLLFGASSKLNHGASVRIFGSGKGRRFPTFGVGVNGASGLRLQVSPAKKLVELYQGEEVKASVAYEWKSETWTYLRLEITSGDNGAFKVTGMVWSAGTPEPKLPTIEYGLKAEPSAGRASVWGSPYSGTPIRFDDLKAYKVSGSQ